MISFNLITIIYNNKETHERQGQTIRVSEQASAIALTYSKEQSLQDYG
jgi:hypothetical protein